MTNDCDVKELEHQLQQRLDALTDFSKWKISDGFVTNSYDFHCEGFVVGSNYYFVRYKGVLLDGVTLPKALRWSMRKWTHDNVRTAYCRRLEEALGISAVDRVAVKRATLDTIAAPNPEKLSLWRKLFGG